MKHNVKSDEPKKTLLKSKDYVNALLHVTLYMRFRMAN